MSVALEPIPPLIDKGAGVEALPTNTLVLKSDASIRLPVPFGVRVRLSSETVPMVAADPAPRLSVVAETPSAAADVIVVRPVAVRVVSEESNTIVLFPELRVRELAPPEVSSPAPTKSNESISSTVPSIDILPRLASSSIVIDPVPAATSNSLKLIAVAPPLIEVRLVPLSVVVPVRFVTNAPMFTIPVPPLGVILISPVVFPPRVRVLLLRLCMVEVEELILTPLPLVLAARVATGVPPATFVIAKAALDVDDPPTLKSHVELIGERRLLFNWK